MKWPALVVASVSVLACGGKVVVDTSAGGGASVGGGASTSTASTSTSTATGAGGAECPDPFPGIQAPCEHEQLTCPVPGACCPGAATCKGGIWTFPGPDCQSLCMVPCGPDNFGCNSVCVIDVSPATKTFRCAQNPCDGTVSCGCATPLCDEKGESCADVSGFTLTCSK